MKRLILLLAGLGFGLYFLLKGLYRFTWRALLVLSLASPMLMGLWLAYALNVLHWKIETLWTMPPLVVLSVVVGIREFSWTEPLIRDR